MDRNKKSIAAGGFDRKTGGGSNSGRIGLWRLGRIRFTMGLAVLALLGAIATGVVSNYAASGSGTVNQDSIKLVYDQINAGNFPRIVSLVSIVNSAGLVIGKLDENNFIVHEDNVRELPIEVVELPYAKDGINVVLTIDRSNSMTGKPLADAKAAACKFVDLMQGDDQSAVVSFSKTAWTEMGFSSNKDSLKAAINHLIAFNWTAVYDAVIHSVELMGSERKNRAIILLTDGADNSSVHSYHEALNACLSNEIRVFSIGLGLQPNSAEELVLKDLATKTGGLYFRSPTSSDLDAIYQAISKLLHHRYQVSYTTHNPAKDGTWRHVKITVVVNTNTSADTARYLAPYEPDPIDPIDDPVDPIDTVVVRPPDPVFEVKPNPFTPNDDGFNDYVEFKNGEEHPTDWSITIMDRSGRLVRQLLPGQSMWDGRDKSGAMMLPGTYLYLVATSDQVIHRGFIHLIR